MASTTTLRAPYEHPLINPQTQRLTEPWLLYFQRLTTANNGNAPVDAQYLVAAADAVLTAERVATNSTSITWDFATVGQAKALRAALTGDVTASADSNVTALSATGVAAGSYGDSTHVATFTVDAKGRLSAAANVSIVAGTVTTTGTPASGNLTKFSGATSITNGDLSGDVTTSGTLVATLANTAVTPGTYGDASNIPQFTVDSKGRLTFAANVAVSTGGATVIGEARLLGDGATVTFSLPDTAEYLMTISDAGLVVDPTTYTLTSTFDGVTFDVAPTTGHVLTFEYVVAQV